MGVETKHKAMIEEFVDKTARLKALVAEMFEANVMFPTIAGNEKLVAQEHSRKMMRAAMQVLESTSAVFKLNLAPPALSPSENAKLGEIKIESPRARRKNKVAKPVKANRFKNLEFD